MNASSAALAWASIPPDQKAANDDFLIIDLFAGGGGASTAIEQATGRSPTIAVNHDKEALALHEANHPNTLHLCEDIRKVDIASVLARFGNRPVGLLWASPDCKDHSKAKGGVPKDKNIRGLAWEVIRWVAAIRRATGLPPCMIALENVEEFQDWGPLHTQGRRANTVNKKRRKETFRLWVKQLESLGGVVEYRELIAARYGAPTTRKRLFVIIRFDGEPIRWPEPTHGTGTKAKKGQGDLFAGPALLPEATAAQCINWNLKCPSIFGRLHDLAEKTMRRIARGIDRFVISAKEPFLIPVTHSTGGNRAYSSGDPVKTLTTSKGGDFQLISPTMFPVTHQGDYRVYDLEASAPTITAAPRGELAIGAAHLLRTDMQSAAERNGIHTPGEPLRTITSGGGFAAATAFLVPRYGERPGQDPRVLPIDGAAPTVVPTGNGGGLASVFLQKMSENGIGYRIDTPLHTAMAGAPRHYEVAAFLGRQFGSTVSGRSLADPHPAVMTNGGGGKSQVVDTTLQAVHIGRQFGKSIGSDAFSPMGAVMAGGGGKTLVVSAKLQPFDGGLTISHVDGAATAFMAQGNGERVGRPITDAITTLTERSTQQQLAVPVLDKYYATGVPQTPDRPLDAITAKARFGLGMAYVEQANTGMVGHPATAPVSTILSKGANQRLVEAFTLPLPAITPPWVNDTAVWEDACAEIGAPAGSRRRDVLEFLWHHFGSPTASEWADPLASHQGRLRFGLVVIDDTVWQIVDIGMRMLTPRELYNAQGFPAGYKIEITLANGRPLTKTAQTRMAGNSVSPPPATALLKVNLPDFMRMRRAA